MSGLQPPAGPVPQTKGEAAWADALIALALFAIDPARMAGIRLRAHAGPVRTRWLEALTIALGTDRPVRKVPCGITEGRLLGGLDLAATLSTGRPVAERGLLAEADGGVLLVAMAERMAAGPAGVIASALDSGSVLVERDGLTLVSDARLGIVLLDESVEADEAPPRTLIERIAFDIDLRSIPLAAIGDAALDASDIATARIRLSRVKVDSSVIMALAETALALDVGSVRADLLALSVARAAAALNGASAVGEAEALLAARLVFASRATRMPAPPEAEADPEQPEEPDDAPQNQAGTAESQSEDEQAPADLGEIMREAVSVHLPADLLARAQGLQGLSRARAEGRSGVAKAAGQRGRITGIRAGMPGPGARLNVVETLRAAAPWQRVRAQGDDLALTGRIRVRTSDLRISRFKSKMRTAIVFLVDASGSQALNRLAEAKGAVELLLADCYVRRDQVAVIAFRGKTADLILPLTHSLTRAKRSLAGLPGGGATPLAAGIDAALELATQVKRSGEMPLVVCLTDGQSNVARNGEGGRKQAEADALASARAIRAAGHAAILIDTAQRPTKRARDVADAMGADYVALPQANAGAVSTVLKEAAAALAG